MHKQLWSHVLTALIAVCMVGLLALALAPVKQKIGAAFNTVNSALNGQKQ